MLFFIVDGNVKLQQKISSTKSVDKTAVIDCHYPSDCSGYIHWYQLKEGKTLKRILYSSISDGSTYNDAGFELFKVNKKESNLALKISELKKEHSAMYYCACWVSGGTVVINTETLHKNPAGFLFNLKPQATIFYNIIFFLLKNETINFFKP